MNFDRDRIVQLATGYPAQPAPLKLSASEQDTPDIGYPVEIYSMNSIGNWLGPDQKVAGYSAQPAPLKLSGSEQYTPVIGNPVEIYSVNSDGLWPGPYGLTSYRISGPTRRVKISKTGKV